MENGMGQNAEESANPALFISDEGFAISFHLIIAEEETKNKLSDLIWTCGGRVEQEYCQMLPKTVLLVDQQTYEKRNDFNRIVFKHMYINDCISKNQLLNLADYLYNKDVEDTPEYFLDVIYYRIRDFRHIEKFPDEEDKLYTVISLSPVASMGSPPGTSSSMLDSHMSRKMLSPLSINGVQKGNKGLFRHYTSYGNSHSSLTSPESISAKSKVSRSTSSNIALNCLLKTLNESPKRTKVGGFKFHKISRLKVKKQTKENNLLSKFEQGKTCDPSRVETVPEIILEKSCDSNGLQTENRENLEAKQPQKVNVNKVKNKLINIIKDNVLKKEQKLVEPSNIRNINLKSDNNDNVKFDKKKDIFDEHLLVKNNLTSGKKESSVLPQRKLSQTKRAIKDCSICNVTSNASLNTIKPKNLLKSDNSLKTQLTVNKSKPTPKPVRAKLVRKEAIWKKKENIKNTSLLKQIGHASIRKKLQDSNLMNKSILSLRSSTNLMNRLENISSHSERGEPVNKSDFKLVEISKTSTTKLKSKQSQHKLYLKTFDELDKNLIQHAISREAVVRLTRITVTKQTCMIDDKAKTDEPKSVVSDRQAKRNESQECGATTRIKLDKSTTKRSQIISQNHKNRISTRFGKIEKSQTHAPETNKNCKSLKRNEKNVLKRSSRIKNNGAKQEMSKNKNTNAKINKSQVKTSTKLEQIPITRSTKRHLLLESNSKNTSKLNGTVPLKKKTLNLRLKKKEEECINESDKKAVFSNLTEKEIKKLLMDKDICTSLLDVLKTKNEFRNCFSRTILNFMKIVNNIKDRNTTHCNDKTQNIKMLRSLRLLRRVAFKSDGSKGPVIGKFKQFLGKILL